MSHTPINHTAQAAGADHCPLDALEQLISQLRAGMAEASLAVRLRELAARIERPAPPARPSLSARQRDVLALMTRGLQNPEIAAVLGLARATVRTHVEQILQRLEVSNRLEAAMEATRLGLVDA